jgi:hypothetical protein
MPDDSTMNKLAQRAVKIHKLLHGLPPDQQGAVIAELTALWMAGHVVGEETHLPVKQRVKTARFHRELLRLHVNQIADMLPAAQQGILDFVGGEARASTH